MSVSRFGSHPPPTSPSPSPSPSVEKVRALELENQQLKTEIVFLKKQLEACRSSPPATVVLPLQARRAVDSGSTCSTTSVLIPSRSVTPVAKPESASSTKRQTQTSTSSSVTLSLDLLELNTPVPGPEDKGGRGILLQSMRKAFQSGKKGESGREEMRHLQKASLKLEKCMALTGPRFVLTHLMKARDCAITASTVCLGGPNVWAEEGKLKTQCEACLSLVSVLEKEWGRQTSSGSFFSRRRTSSTSSTNN